MARKRNLEHWLKVARNVERDDREQKARRAKILTARVALKYSVTSSGDFQTDVGLWEKPFEEVDRGWLVTSLD